MNGVPDFYRTPSRTSDLGRHAYLADDLSIEPEALSRLVRGVLVHNFTARVRGLTLPAERMGHMQTVGAEAIVTNVLSLDPRPLQVKRPVERRMVGFCYHFALLHCALLRATGTPARVRCGFGGYFEASRWIDHWIVEYWQNHEWHLTDPQVGRDVLTEDDFQDAVTAWRLCRDGAAAPRSYGNGEFWGWDELRGSLINDVAALNRVEVAGWYWCDRLKVEPLDRPHAELDTALDTVARLAASSNSIRGIAEAFDLYPDLRPPADAVAR